jgi:hypothetical protein
MNFNRWWLGRLLSYMMLYHVVYHIRTCDSEEISALILSKRIENGGRRYLQNNSLPQEGNLHNQPFLKDYCSNKSSAQYGSMPAQFREKKATMSFAFLGHTSQFHHRHCIINSKPHIRFMSNTLETYKML